MLKPTFHLMKKYRVVLYARMSSRMQNPRSPDQQIEEIKRLIKRLNLPWTIVEVYRDDATSGRYKKKRPGYLNMIRDLKSGRKQADLILVDTFERLTRGEDADEIRRKLENGGILVLTADSNFADPTTSQGKALSKIESIRATQEGFVKAHNVVRGKRDSIRRGRWPGGPVPYGFKLENVMRLRKGFDEIDYRILVPDAQTKSVVRHIFCLAKDNNWGGSRLFKSLKTSKTFPEDLLPSSAHAVTYILQNELYKGVYVWRKNCTGIVNDSRVIQALPEEEWEVNSEFCEPIVEPEIWDLVAKQRFARSKHSQDTAGNSNSIPSSRGIALKHPLSGLVVCMHCGRSMNPSCGGKYTSKSGEEHRYVSYTCTGYLNGVCPNSHRIPEPKLRKTVFDLLLSQLFLTDECSS